jgi:phosphatidylserine/phosphatidylglycerophosphate/cardiolipin synthase-like enzyme
VEENQPRMEKSQNTETGERSEIDEGKKDFRLPLTFFGEDTDENKPLKSPFTFKEGKILVDHELAPCILDIVDKTEKYCFIVTPFFELNPHWRHLERIFKKAYNDKKKIFFISKKQEESSQKDKDKESIKIIKEYFNDELDLFFCDFLHSKIYLNEKQVLITSMNLNNYAKDNNFEIGCLIDDCAVSEWIVNNVILKTILEKQDVERIKTKLNEVSK